MPVILFLLPSLCGFLMFFLVPFIAGIGYALTDHPVNGRFVGLGNIIGLFRNGAFLLALKNTALFMIPSVFLNTILPLVIALPLVRTAFFARTARTLFISPMAVPAATVILFWQIFFEKNGVMNHLLAGMSMGPLDFLDGTWGIAVASAVYIWKNIGYNMILYIAGIGGIPNEHYESADMDGAGPFSKFVHITLPGLVPTIFFVFTISIVNCFKIFREIYLIFGRHPNENVYMLQNFMNNMFLELNYPKLTSAAYIIAMLITFVLMIMYLFERKAAKDFY